MFKPRFESYCVKVSMIISILTSFRSDCQIFESLEPIHHEDHTQELNHHFRRINNACINNTHTLASSTLSISHTVFQKPVLPITWCTVQFVQINFGGVVVAVLVTGCLIFWTHVVRYVNMPRDSAMKLRFLSRSKNRILPRTAVMVLGGTANPVYFCSSSATVFADVGGSVLFLSAMLNGFVR